MRAVSEKKVKFFFTEFGDWSRTSKTKPKKIHAPDNLKHNYIKLPSKKNCRYCEFNQTEHCDSGVK